MLNLFFPTLLFKTEIKTSTLSTCINQFPSKSDRVSEKMLLMVVVYLVPSFH